MSLKKKTTTKAKVKAKKKYAKPKLRKTEISRTNDYAPTWSCCY